ncbi:amidase [Trueperella bonasi]|uniref:Amidase n=1 Tax=Trueperella bonasi TaxID=312286 RepID=A0ABT9NHD0_9ACTO|nr:acetamidase/formamidase family protein [Trueperella bonasi]MDP9806807.1 amidase [Trueperella bonasi]
MTNAHYLSKADGTDGFHADREPKLRIEPGTGEKITFETDDEAYAQMHEFRSMEKVTATLNPLTGPVYVEGAQPGDVLAVTIHDIKFPSNTGWSVYLPGAGALAEPMGDQMYTRKINLTEEVAHVTEDISVPLQPMIGCIGVAAADVTMSTVMPSYPTGGNMDLTDAAPGSTVYLPVQVEGALLYIGDLHAVMSRGESSFVAIEAAGEATVSVDLVKAPADDDSLARLRAPRVETDDEIIAVGLGNPVQDSIVMAYESLFDVLTTDKGLSNEDAYTLMSAVAHTELGGPTGSEAPDPLHPFRAIGAVTLARIEKKHLN